MSGVNPYIERPKMEMPQRSYKITFLPMKVTVECDPTSLSEKTTGLPGSLLSIATANGIDLDHSCGGVCACSTCHVIVREGGESCSEATDDEEDMLDMAPGLQAQSRLACQCIPNGTKDLVVEIPEWNRNFVSEAPH
ncbi:2Fe-2S iron-sulfur cluster-binding protein [Deltaproteobacteria bacterium TL4]